MIRLAWPRLALVPIVRDEGVAGTGPAVLKCRTRRTGVLIAGRQAS
jgi:hypothetical protein